MANLSQIVKPIWSINQVNSNWLLDISCLNKLKPLKVLKTFDFDLQSNKTYLFFQNATETFKTFIFVMNFLKS